MAIGPSGGSAASRFRPRGTQPTGSLGLGRRNLLATEEEDQVSTTQAASDTEQDSNNPTDTQPPFPMSSEPSVAVTPPAEAVSIASDALVSEVNPSDRSTSTAAPTASPRGRGRPALGTRTAASQPSPVNMDTGALSVPAARARMREIEASVKSRRASLQTEIVALQRACEADINELRREYQGLADIVLGE